MSNRSLEERIAKHRQRVSYANIAGYVSYPFALLALISFIIVAAGVTSIGLLIAATVFSCISTLLYAGNMIASIVLNSQANALNNERATARSDSRLHAPFTNILVGDSQKQTDPEPPVLQSGELKPLLSKKQTDSLSGDAPTPGHL